MSDEREARKKAELIKSMLVSITFGGTWGSTLLSSQPQSQHPIGKKGWAFIHLFPSFIVWGLPPKAPTPLHSMGATSCGSKGTGDHWGRSKEAKLQVNPGVLWDAGCGINSICYIKHVLMIKPMADDQQAWVLTSALWLNSDLFNGSKPLTLSEPQSIW